MQDSGSVIVGHFLVSLRNETFKGQLLVNTELRSPVLGAGTSFGVYPK
jgi:hypothetical protein